MKKSLCICCSLLILLSFSSCSNNIDKEQTTTMTTFVAETTTTATIPSTTVLETTTEEPTTEATTAGPDYSINKKFADELKAGVFYMSGTINPDSKTPTKVYITCDNTNIRATIESAQATMTVVQLDGASYLINNQSNKYAEITEESVKDIDTLLGSLSAYGVSFTGSEKSEIKNMISEIDQSFDYSQYIENAQYEEFISTQNDKTLLCTRYKTENGTCAIYTCENSLYSIDIYDSEGLRQINFIIDAFIPEVLVPITMTGFTKTGSILDLFVQTY